MTRRIALLGGLGVAIVGVSVFFVSQWALAGQKVHANRHCSQAERPSLDEVNHAGFDRLLQKYVDRDGFVDYTSWKASRSDLAALDAYLGHLGCVNLRKATTREAKLSFWINAYNALTLRGILREYPTSSIRNHTARLGYNIWKDYLISVDGTYYSLDDIEHRILRKMGEPRIHFAVNCASIGCPPLVNRAFTAENLSAFLDANASRFFSRPSNFRTDPSSSTVYVSSLLKWYGSDFAASPAEQMRKLKRFFPNPDVLGWIDAKPIRVRYLTYDWNLNDQKRQTGR